MSHNRMTLPDTNRQELKEPFELRNPFRYSNVQLESFIEHSADAINILNLDGYSLKINPAYEKIYGWKAEEVIGRKYVTVPEDLIEETEQLIQAVREGKLVSAYETRRRRKDGSVFDVSLTFSPMKDSEGKINAIALIVRDISQRKHFEQALRESEEKYRIIAENTSDLIALVKADGVVTYASPSHRHVTGFHPDEIVGKTPFSLIHEEDRSRVQAIFQQMLAEKTPQKAEFRLHCRNGLTVDLEAKGTPVFSQTGEVEMIVVVSRDITDRKKSESLFRKSEKLAMVGQLAAGIAHEIRNPLAALKGFIQLMQSGAADKPQYYEIMLTELNRIEQYTNELLILAKPQAVTFKNKNVGTILHAVAALLQSQAILNNVSFVTDIDLSLPAIKCEENQMKQVFINILQNAIEAMPNGGCVYISARFKKGKIIIRFRDEGNGIPKERIPKLGEPFYTTKEKGTGLGLTVSFKIIEEHKGSIRIQSKLCKGTIIDVILPVSSSSCP